MYEHLVEQIIYEDNWDLEKIEETAKGLDHPEIFFMYLLKVVRKQRNLTKEDWTQREHYSFWNNLVEELSYIEYRVKTLRSLSNKEKRQTHISKARVILKMALEESNSEKNCRTYKKEFEKHIPSRTTRSNCLWKLIKECDIDKILWRRTAMDFYDNKKYDSPKGRKTKEVNL
jgi:hypothetical protein